MATGVCNGGVNENENGGTGSGESSLEIVGESIEVIGGVTGDQGFQNGWGFVECSGLGTDCIVIAIPTDVRVKGVNEQADIEGGSTVDLLLRVKVNTLSQESVNLHLRMSGGEIKQVSIRSFDCLDSTQNLIEEESRDARKETEFAKSPGDQIEMGGFQELLHDINNPVDHQGCEKSESVDSEEAIDSLIPISEVNVEAESDHAGDMFENSGLEDDGTVIESGKVSQDALLVETNADKKLDLLETQVSNLEDGEPQLPDVDGIESVELDVKLENLKNENAETEIIDNVKEPNNVEIMCIENEAAQSDVVVSPCNPDDSMLVGEQIENGGVQVTEDCSVEGMAYRTGIELPDNERTEVDVISKVEHDIVGENSKSGEQVMIENIESIELDVKLENLNNENAETEIIDNVKEPNNVEIMCIENEAAQSDVVVSPCNPDDSMLVGEQIENGGVQVTEDCSVEGMAYKTGVELPDNERTEVDVISEVEHDIVGENSKSEEQVMIENIESIELDVKLENLDGENDEPEIIDDNKEPPNVETAMIPDDDAAQSDAVVSPCSPDDPMLLGEQIEYGVSQVCEECSVEGTVYRSEIEFPDYEHREVEVKETPTLIIPQLSHDIVEEKAKSEEQTKIENTESVESDVNLEGLQNEKVEPIDDTKEPNNVEIVSIQDDDAAHTDEVFPHHPDESHDIVEEKAKSEEQTKIENTESIESDVNLEGLQDEKVEPIDDTKEPNNVEIVSIQDDDDAAHTDEVFPHHPNESHDIVEEKAKSEEQTEIENTESIESDVNLEGLQNEKVEPIDDTKEPNNVEIVSIQDDDAAHTDEVFPRHPDESTFVAEQIEHGASEVPGFDEELLGEQIKDAQLQLDEKTKFRDTIRSEFQLQRATLKDHNHAFNTANLEMVAARRLIKLKRHEISSVQSVINRVKNIIAVEDIDSRISKMERTMEHGTLTRKDEKQLIREIKQLKCMRDQLSSNLGSQYDIHQALNEKDEAEDQMMTLKDELNSLKDKFSKAEAVALSIRKACEEEKEREKELRARFKVADETRQQAYAHLNDLKIRLDEKNKAASKTPNMDEPLHANLDDTSEKVAEKMAKTELRLAEPAVARRDEIVNHQEKERTEPVEAMEWMKLDAEKALIAQKEAQKKEKAREKRRRKNERKKASKEANNIGNTSQDIALTKEPTEIEKPQQRSPAPPPPPQPHSSAKHLKPRNFPAPPSATGNKRRGGGDQWRKMVCVLFLISCFFTPVATTSL